VASVPCQADRRVRRVARGCYSAATAAGREAGATLSDEGGS